MPNLVTTADAISPAWLTDVLQQDNAQNQNGLDGATVTALQWQTIGTGKMGDNARLTITYDRPTSAPCTLVGKFPAADAATKATAGAMGAYRAEVNFYRALAQLTDAKTPRIYHADIDDSGLDFVLLMEDLAPATPGNQLIGETEYRAQSALTEAAKLHAAFTGKIDLFTNDYILQDTADSAAFGQALLQEHWPGFVTRFGDKLNADTIDMGERFAAHYANWSTRFQGEKTLIHADFRSENLLFAPDSDGNESVTIVDWQGIKASSGLADVAYLLGGSLQINLRRKTEKSLVEHYRKQLNALGVSLSAENCWEQYREFALHGIMITVLGAMFTDADERGDKMFLTMAQRHLQQCVDLRSDEFLQP